MSSAQLRSPRGVSDLFVDFDEATFKQVDLNNSFSWTDNGCPKQAQNSSNESQIQEIKERLHWLQEQSVQDKQDYKEKLREAKFHCREQLQKKYSPLLHHSADSQANERLLFDLTKIIQYLRDDNTKLRQEIKVYKRQIAQLIDDNELLEKANKKTQQAIEELHLHVQGLDSVNQNLNHNCEIFKSSLKQMKDDYMKCQADFHSEARAGMAYEVWLAKILSQVKGRSNDETLRQSVVAIAEDYYYYLLFKQDAVHNGQRPNWCCHRLLVH
jgi:chromosome segregation ATPase